MDNIQDYSQIRNQLVNLNQVSQNQCMQGGQGASNNSNPFANGETVEKFIPELINFPRKSDRRVQIDSATEVSEAESFDYPPPFTIPTFEEAKI